MTAPTRRDLAAAGIAAAAVLLLSLVVAHVRDAGRDKELERLHGMITRDSAARVAAVVRTDTLGRRLDTAARAAARVDTVWRAAATNALARVDTIVRGVAPDSSKIAALAHIDSSLVVAGTALADTTHQLRAAAIDFRAQVAVERSAWATERETLAQALKVSEARHRHWGLGATLGYGVMRDNAGEVRAGPTLNVGITYRW